MRFLCEDFAMTEELIRIVIADDHEVVRCGLASLLDNSNIKIVAEAESGDEAVKLAKKHKPDVILLDVRMAPGTDGLVATGKNSC